MDSHVFKALEFDKILVSVSEHAVMDITKERILAPDVSENIRKVNILQNETADAVTLLTKKGNPPIMCAHDITASL